MICPPQCYNGNAPMTKFSKNNNPTSYGQAKGKEEWEEAMQVENNALMKYQTCELVHPLTRDENLFGHLVATGFIKQS